MSKLTRTTRVGRGISHHPVCLCEVKEWSTHDAPTRLMWSSSIVRVSCWPPSWLVLAGYFILVRLVISHQLHPSGDTDYLTCEITPELHPLGSTKRQDRSALHGSICSSRLLWWFATVSRRLARSGVAKKQPPDPRPNSPLPPTTLQHVSWQQQYIDFSRCPIAPPNSDCHPHCLLWLLYRQSQLPFILYSMLFLTPHIPIYIYMSFDFPSPFFLSASLVSCITRTSLPQLSVLAILLNCKMRAYIA